MCEGVLHNMPGETTDTLVAVKVLYQLLSVYFYLSFFVEEKGSVFISVPLSVRPLTMLRSDLRASEILFMFLGPKSNFLGVLVCLPTT